MSKRALLIFWVVLAVLLVISSTVFYNELLVGLGIALESGDGVHTPEPEGTSTTAIVSLLASVATLIGFVSTTILAWRRESRDVERAQLDLQRQALEIEKLRHELDTLRKRADDHAAG